MNSKTYNYTVNGLPIYEPQVQVTESVESVMDENSGRSDDGTMHVFWKDKTIKKFSLQYNALTAEEYNEMKQLLQGKTFRFGYWNNGAVTKISAYCEATSASLLRIDGTSGIYTGVQFDIIQL